MESAVLPPGIDLNNQLPTANQEKITQIKIKEAVRKFQSHSIDCGSAPVQSKRILVGPTYQRFNSYWYLLVAILTEKIINLARHFASHKKDHHSKRGFEVIPLLFAVYLLYIGILLASNFYYVGQFLSCYRWWYPGEGVWCNISKRKIFAASKIL